MTGQPCDQDIVTFVILPGSSSREVPSYPPGTGSLLAARAMLCSRQATKSRLEVHSVTVDNLSARSNMSMAVTHLSQPQRQMEHRHHTFSNGPY